MKNWKNKFNETVSEQDITSIKEEFSIAIPSTRWEDYYWAAKCLWEYDEDAFDAAFVLSLLKSALKYGLTYTQDKDLYLDAINMLATLSMQSKDYDSVLNYLNMIIERNQYAPDWVFHNLISAQIHTDYMPAIMKHPKMFLDDLGRNDSGTEEVIQRQKNLFKDFIIQAMICLHDNPEIHVDHSALLDAAQTYGYVGSDGWNNFEAMLSGVVPEQIKPIVNSSVNTLSSVLAAPANEESDTALIVDLFPDEPKPATSIGISAEEYERILAENEKLREKQDALEANEAENSKIISAEAKERQKLQAQNENLQAEVSRLAKENADAEANSSAEKAARAKSEEDNEALKNSNATLQSENAGLKAENDNLKINVKGLHCENDNLRRTNQSLASDNEAFVQKNSELQVQNDEKQKEIERLKSQPIVQNTINPLIDVPGHIGYYQQEIAKRLAQFLAHELPKCSSQWWDTYVISPANGDTRKRIADNGLATLEDLDLAALLTTLSSSWKTICRNTNRCWNQSDFDDIYKMKDIRRRWAHRRSGEPLPEKAQVKEDLYIMQDFMILIHCGKPLADEVKGYIRTLNSMEF